MNQAQYEQGLTGKGGPLTVTAPERDRVAQGISESVEAWEQGRACIPDTMDFVILYLEQVEGEISYEEAEEIANELWEAQQDGHTAQDPISVANWLAKRIGDQD